MTGTIEELRARYIKFREENGLAQELLDMESGKDAKTKFTQSGDWRDRKVEESSGETKNTIDPVKSPTKDPAKIDDKEEKKLSDELNQKCTIKGGKRTPKYSIQPRPNLFPATPRAFVALQGYPYMYPNPYGPPSPFYPYGPQIPPQAGPFQCAQYGPGVKQDT